MGRSFQFKQDFPFETRVKESAKMRHKYPDRVPVIVEKAGRTDLLDLEKKKYLVPEDLTVGEFVYVIRRRLQLSPEQALFFFVNDILPPNASLMSSVYKNQKDKDGFLYFNYSGEKTFGSTDLPGVRPS